ncbi:MAG TPA: [Fe-Fe] hydrogenase large subunit C-terminal domain-containing protein [Candidatus Nanoarchaeia archaeon]|nr:[Fe-Fe] hydrogenase large subunit C-terminal domain-containing protein [Candidatus Nanoarchaeia archaeon]
MQKEDNIKKVEKILKDNKKKSVVMLAPSFVIDFSYPEIISMLKKLGFDKIVEVTFGAKMINREYHDILKNSKEMKISSVCPGVVDFIRNKYPQYRENLIKVDSPMVAMGKICKKTYKRYKVVFISPCDFKKKEAKESKYVDYVLDFGELDRLFKKEEIKSSKKKIHFDKFYNDYTKIYPVSGGLFKTAHLKGIVKKRQVKIKDGFSDVIKILKKNPEKKYKFLDVTFCPGGCIGGPCVISDKKIKKRKKDVRDYLNKAKREDIPESRKGLIEYAKGLNFRKTGF